MKTLEKDNNIIMKRDVFIVLVVLCIVCLGCSFSIDIGKPKTLEQQIEIPSNYYEKD